MPVSASASTPQRLETATVFLLERSESMLARYMFKPSAWRRRGRLAVATLGSVILHAVPLLSLTFHWNDLEETEQVSRFVAIERLEIEERRPVDDALVEAEEDAWVERQTSAKHSGRALDPGTSTPESRSAQLDAPLPSSRNARSLPTHSRTEPTVEGSSHDRASSLPEDGSSLHPTGMEAGATRQEQGPKSNSAPVQPASYALDEHSEARNNLVTAVMKRLTPTLSSPSRNHSSRTATPHGDENASSLDIAGEKSNSQEPDHFNESAHFASSAGISAPFGQEDPLAAERIDYLEVAALARLRARQASMDLYLLEVRRRIEPHWRPRFVLRGRRGEDAAKTLLDGRRSTLTRVAVRIDSRGRVREARVSGTSGLVQLDAHALEAFRSAAPFPPPPRHLLEEGELAFEWGARARR